MKTSTVNDWTGVGDAALVYNVLADVLDRGEQNEGTTQILRRIVDGLGRELDRRAGVRPVGGV